MLCVCVVRVIRIRILGDSHARVYLHVTDLPHAAVLERAGDILHGDISDDSIQADPGVHTRLSKADNM